MTTLNWQTLVCMFDALNPCWNGRKTDVPGKHWGVGDACPTCCARAALAAAKGES